MTEFRLLWQFLRPHRQLMLAVLASILVVTGCSMLTPWLLREIVQIVRTATDASAAAQGVGWVALGLLIVYGLRSAGLFLNMHLSHIVAWNACHDVRLALYRRLQRMPPAFYANRQTGELASRVMKDSDNLEPLVADSVYAFVVGALQTLGSAAILIVLNPSLALPALAPLPIAAFLIIRLGRRVTPAFDQEAEQNGELSALVHDNISGMKEIQIFNRERHEYDRVYARSRTLAHAQIYARKLAAGITPVVEGATGLSIVLVVWLGGQAALSGRIPIEDVVAFVLYLIAFYTPLYDMVDSVENFERAKASLRRIGEVLTTQPEVADSPESVDPGRLRGQVRFANVSFGYRPDTPVLQGIDATVEAGQTLALVGPTGAGKSTLVSLVPRFHDPQTGAVLIDGMDARQITLDALRRNISMVLQDVFLFNGTVRENIRFGRPDADDAEIEAAAKVANAHEFIEQLPFGYDTEIGERGVKLSGGQKQRLSIARAVLKDAPILILDEATSAVDTETEALIQQALARLMRGRTCLVIAHRLSTIRNADQIIVLDQGRIVEHGRHGDLLLREGLYRRLHARQHAVHGDAER